MSSEVFIKNTGEPYRFELDMSYTDCLYDISFFTRIDSRHKVPGFPMEVRWISPSGNIYCEEVYFDCSEHNKVMYRKDLSPLEEGIWTLEARADAEGMTGLGLICERK